MEEVWSHEESMGPGMRGLSSDSPWFYCFITSDLKQSNILTFLEVSSSLHGDYPELLEDVHEQLDTMSDIEQMLSKFQFFSFCMHTHLLFSSIKRQ